MSLYENTQTEGSRPDAVHAVRSMKHGPRKSKLIRASGRRYFDSGEFCMAKQEGKVPDDILPNDRDARANADAVAKLAPMWKCAGYVAPSERPRPQASRLSVASSS